MFFNVDIKADALSPGTVCLTYDDGPGETPGDGPGPRSREIGQYLAERGIRATFFVMGRHAESLGGLLGQLSVWGHCVGNHTYSHPGLVGLAERGGDVVSEIDQTDRLIRRHQRDEITFLRPPYGNWRQETAPGDPGRPVSIVAERLNASSLAARYVGPINWDISAEDYDYWRDGKSAEECAARYLRLIQEQQRGIVLMHDSSENLAMRSANRAFEVTRLVVSALSRRGYHFVGLDEIPQVRSAARVVKQVVLRIANVGSLVLRERDRRLAVTTSDLGMAAQFGVVELEDGWCALRASNGLFVERRESGGVFAAATKIGPRQMWRPVLIDKRRTLLRGVRGRFLRLVEGPHELEISGTASRSSAAVFEWVDLFPTAVRPRAGRSPNRS
jgi:peptidoglycan/xylan/chitin deacetylase (PgdA/CDA1 family)